MRKFILVVLMLIPGMLSADTFTGSRSRLGTAIGLPQIISLTYQFSPSRDISLEAYAGTTIFAHSLGGRLILGNTTRGFHPRAFAGLALFDMNYASYEGNPTGTALYAWFGGGFTFAFDSHRIFLDIGHMGTDDENRGIGKGMMTISVGVLFDLGSDDTSE